MTYQSGRYHSFLKAGLHPLASSMLVPGAVGAGTMGLIGAGSAPEGQAFDQGASNATWGLGLGAGAGALYHGTKQLENVVNPLAPTMAPVAQDTETARKLRALREWAQRTQGTASGAEGAERAPNLEASRQWAQRTQEIVPEDPRAGIIDLKSPPNLKLRPQQVEQLRTVSPAAQSAPVGELSNAAERLTAKGPSEAQRRNAARIAARQAAKAKATAAATPTMKPVGQKAQGLGKMLSGAARNLARGL